MPRGEPVDEREEHQLQVVVWSTARRDVQDRVAQRLSLLFLVGSNCRQTRMKHGRDEGLVLG